MFSAPVTHITDKAKNPDQCNLIRLHNGQPRVKTNTGISHSIETTNLQVTLVQPKTTPTCKGVVIRPLGVSCGVWHLDVSSRAFGPYWGTTDAQSIGIWGIRITLGSLLYSSSWASFVVSQGASSCWGGQLPLGSAVAITGCTWSAMAFGWVVCVKEPEHCIVTRCSTLFTSPVSGVVADQCI